MKSAAQLKCTYTNAHISDTCNKQEELEVMVEHENCDVVAIMETWWDDLRDWSAAMDGYKLFRRDGRGRRGGGVALYIREALGAMELEINDDKVECLCVRIRGRPTRLTSRGGVCYRPPNQDQEVDVLFYKQLKDVSRSPALVLVGDFNLTDMYWELNTEEKRQSRRFLEYMEESFLSQLVSDPTRGGALLDLLFINKKGLVGDVVGGRLGYSDSEIIEFSIFGETRRGINKTSTLDFWRVDFGLFKRLIWRVPWETAFENKGVQEGWTYFKKEVLKAQEQTVPMC